MFGLKLFGFFLCVVQEKDDFRKYLYHRTYIMTYIHFISTRTHGYLEYLHERQWDRVREFCDFHWVQTRV